MKNNGFTLIELLAVIIILAIIALITVPAVFKLIENAKDESLEVSAKGYIEGINECIMSERLVGNNITSNKVKELNELCSNYLKGDLPTGGTVKIEDGVITDYDLIFSDGANNEDTSSNYSIGDPFYYNPVDGEVCEQSDYEATLNSDGKYANSINEYKGSSGNSGCMKWYVIKNNSNTIDLLLDHNTTYKKEWITGNDYGTSNNLAINNDKGPVTLLEQLYADTDGWTGVATRTDAYIDPLKGYTINYNGYKARLIEANEIAEITDANEILGWDSATSTNYYYLDGKYGADSTWQTQVATSQGSSNYAWLFDYTGYIDSGVGPINCLSYGCDVAETNTRGYWTSSASSFNSYSSFAIAYTGSVSSGEVSYNYYGIRPVITVTKS